MDRQSTVCPIFNSLVGVWDMGAPPAGREGRLQLDTTIVF